MQLYLEVILNDAPTGLIANFTERAGGRLAASESELGELGIAVDPVAEAMDGLYDLDKLPGLTYRYDQAAQLLRVTAEVGRLVTHVIDGRFRPAGPVAGPVGSSVGAVVNYTLYGSSDADFGIAVAGALDGRVVSPYGVFSQSGIAKVEKDGAFSAVRLDTSYTYSDQSHLLTYQAGDFVSGGLAWTRPLRLGGVRAARNFTLRPDLVTMPVPAFAGSAAVPSTVDVYANGISVYSGAVQPGPFSLVDLPIVSGVGTARVVVTDALGRKTESSLPFFASSALLRKGLLDFSVEGGLPRRSFGTSSFDYAPDPAVSASARYGVTDILTLEAHAEATAGLVNAGAGVVTPLFGHGLISVAGAASAGRGEGALVAADADLQLGHFALRLRTQRTFGDYLDVAAVSAISSLTTTGEAKPPRAIDQASLSLPLWDASRVTVSLVHAEKANGEDALILGAAYGRRIFGDMNLYVQGFRAFDGSGKAGLFLGLSKSLGGGISATSGLRDDSGAAGGSLDLSRPERNDVSGLGGIGWRLAGTAGGQQPSWLAAASYKAPAFHLAANLRGTSSDIAGGIEMSGAVAAAGGGVFFANRIDDAFAVVDVGAPGVTVYSENRPVGKTNSGGKILVPSLRSWESNTISIDPDDLPADATAERTKVVVRPGDHGAATIDFSIADSSSAASVVIRNAGGVFLPPGSSGHLDGGEDFVVGYDGIAYLRGLRPQNRVTVALADGASCSASFPYAASASGRGHAPDVVCR